MSFRHMTLKPIFSTKKPSSSRFRFILLLFLIAYAGVSVLRLSLSFAPPSSPTNRFPSTNHHYPSSVVITNEAIRRESESNLKTHIHSEKKHLLQSDEHQPATPVSCSALVDGRSTAAGDGRGLLCCDRNSSRTDVCYMRGDIRLDTRSSSILVYGTTVGAGAREKIRPYTRKFENQLMSTISEITIHPVNESKSWRRQPECEVRHEGVPGLVFSAGGYTGNLYHEFSDGLIPLYLTAGRFRGEVVLVITEKRAWWLGKYQRVLERLSNYKVIDFAADRRIHCFSEMIVGLKIHGEMMINPALMPNGESIQDFQNLLHEGFGGVESLELPSKRISPLLRSSHHGGGGGGGGGNTSTHSCGHKQRQKLVIFTRRFTRVLLNLQAVVRACRSAGFDVQIINPAKGFSLEALDDALQSADAMLAVHGAAMSHFLFMRPAASVLIQIVPLGLEWPAMEFYGKPAKRLGLEYMPYKITPQESSLYKEYESNSEVLRNPSAISSGGWMEMKKIYLDNQNVTISIKRFSRLLSKVRSRVCDFKLNINDDTREFI